MLDPAAVPRMAGLAEILARLEDTNFSSAIRGSELLFPWIEGVHVIAVTFLFGAIFIVDARLIGLFSRDEPVSQLAAAVLPLVWAAFALALLSGLSMFAATPARYVGNIFFQIKMLLIVLAGVNMLFFHRVVYRDVGHWDHLLPPPASARATAGLSIALWTAIVALGRYIGFSLN